MNHEISKSQFNVRRITVAGILSALSIALNITPIGFIMIPGLQVQITLMHIPTIIGAILEGPVVGAFVGMIFGLASLYTATYTPLPVAFAFLNPLVSVLPRILIGIVAHYSYSALNKALKEKGQVLSIGVSSILATVTNTIGVLGMIYILYAKRYIDALGLTGKVSGIYIFAMALPNAPLEVLAAVLLSVPVVLAVRKMRN
jgi:uncharacterized membrane protein